MQSHQERREHQVDTNPTAQAKTAPDPMLNQPADPKPEGGNKMVLWLIIGLVVIILIVGGIYFYMSKQQSVSNPSATPAPASQSQENLENDINSVDVSAVEGDFSPVDQDLKNL